MNVQNEVMQSIAPIVDQAAKLGPFVLKIKKSGHYRLSVAKSNAWMEKLKSRSKVIHFVFLHTMQAVMSTAFSCSSLLFQSAHRVLAASNIILIILRQTNVLCTGALLQVA